MFIRTVCGAEVAATCVNTELSYSCICNDGYQGGGGNAIPCSGNIMVPVLTNLGTSTCSVVTKNSRL